MSNGSSRTMMTAINQIVFLQKKKTKVSFKNFYYRLIFFVTVAFKKSQVEFICTLINLKNKLNRCLNHEKSKEIL